MLVGSIAVQTILLSALLVDPVRSAKSLTIWGNTFYHPERDVDIYIIGVVAALTLCLILALIWGRTVSRRGISGNRSRLALTVRLGLAAVATTWFLRLWFDARDAQAGGRDPGSWELAIFLLLGLATLAAAFPVEQLRRTTTAEPDDDTSPVGPDAVHPRSPSRLRFSPLDLVVPVLIFVLVYVPAWPQLAGRLFMTDAFMHWDYYAMGPALALNSGQALGTDSYAMYGVGWPTLFSLLSPWLPLTYGRILQLSVLYGCIYFTGFYLLLRLLLLRPWLAAVGTGIALGQLFLGMPNGLVWALPSLTVLRWAFDVWCFVALVRYRNTRRPIWAFAAGASIGLAVVFSSDTGIYLAAAATFYLVCSAWGDHAAAPKPRHAGALLLSTLMILTAGLAIAARGTILSRAFWTGWLEPLQDYRGGFAQLPLITAGNETIATFAILIVIYVAVAGNCLAKVLYRRATTLDLFTGTFAVYGLMNLIHFVGRSADGTFYRLTLPLVLICALYGGHFYSRSEERLAARWGGRGRLVPPAVAGGALALMLLLALFAAPSGLLLDPVKTYPNLANRTLHGKEPTGLCLVQGSRDVCGLPPELEPTVSGFHAVAARLKELDQQGRSAAIIDESGSILYLASGQEPLGRYPRMFLNMYSKQKEQNVLDALTRNRPDYVLTRTAVENTAPDYKIWFYFGIGPSADTFYPDTWANLLEWVRQDYVLLEQMHPFELWVRKP